MKLTWSFILVFECTAKWWWLKLVGNTSKRNKALKDCKKFNPVVLDKTQKSVVLQITALRREIDTVMGNLKKFGLVSVSRTGAVAMTRGSEIFK